MPEPEVIRLARQFREDLLMREYSQFQAMSETWARTERTLDSLFNALVYEAQATGVSSRWQLSRMARYAQMLEQVRAELGKYNDYAATLIGQKQAENLTFGMNAGRDLLQAVNPPPGIIAGLNRISTLAAEYAIGFAFDGTPLRNLLDEWNLAISDDIANKLAEGVILGRNPVATARLMRSALGLGFDRSLLVARTEQIRAYREATRKTYQDSGVVVGYRRVASKSLRTCMACLIADGRFYPLDASFEEHPNGRCSLIPVLAGSEPISWKYGRDWFMEQEPEKQIQMMGVKKWQAWQNGAFDLEQVVKRVDNPTWGAHLAPRSLKELLGDEF